METTFTPAKRGDLETLLELLREYCAEDEVEFEEELARPALETLLRDDSLGRAFLIRDGWETIGCVVLTFGFSLEVGGRAAFLDEYYIRERYRGEGRGALMLTFVEDTCRELDMRVLHLTVARGDTAARRFYQDAGFDEQERSLMTRWIAPRDPGE